MTVLGLALTQACGAEAGRYTFQTLPDGLMRLDTATGEMSLCTKRSAGWVCAAVADDRAALDAEVGRLERENARLKSALLAHGLRLPEGVTGEAGGGLELPDARQLDRLMGFFERLWGRLLDMVRTLQNDWATDKDFEEREPRFPDRSHQRKDLKNQRVAKITGCWQWPLPTRQWGPGRCCGANAMFEEFADVDPP